MRGLELIADHLGKAPVGYLTAEGGPFVLSSAGPWSSSAVVVWIRTRWRPPRAATAFAVAVLPVFVWASALGSGPPAGLTVRFFDVGQGDAALAHDAGGRHRSWSTGDRSERAGRHRARGARREAAGHRRGESSARRPHRRGCRRCCRACRWGSSSSPGARTQSPPLQADLDRAIADEDVPVAEPAGGRHVLARVAPSRHAVARSMLDGDRVRYEQRRDRRPRVAP